MINYGFPHHVDLSALSPMLPCFSFLKRERKTVVYVCLFLFLINTVTLKYKRIRSNDLERTETCSGGTEAEGNWLIRNRHYIQTVEADLQRSFEEDFACPTKGRTSELGFPEKVEIGVYSSCKSADVKKFY